MIHRFVTMIPDKKSQVKAPRLRQYIHILSSAPLGLYLVITMSQNQQNPQNQQNENIPDLSPQQIVAMLQSVQNSAVSTKSAGTLILIRLIEPAVVCWK
jgi:uncharacterized BrkB/YihY/UPF0761 family membrane protein